MTKQHQHQTSFFDLSSYDSETSHNNSAFLSNSWLIANHGIGHGASSQSAGNASLDAQVLDTAIGNGTLFFAGDSGEVISTVQSVLGISKTGVMDATTVAAVRTFQQGNGLSVDGIVGPQTLGAVKSALATSSAPSVTTGTTQEDSPVNPATMEEANQGVVNAQSIAKAVSDGALFRAGAVGDAVSVVQGILGVAQSGSVDSATVAAVRQFQTDAGLTVDGVLGPATLTALMKNTTEKAVDNEVIFDIGSSGPEVLGIQMALGLSSGGQTGIYGETTAQMVRQFQANNNIQQTGKIGPTTWAALKETASGLGRPLGKFDAYRSGQFIGQIDVVEMDGVKVAAHVAHAWRDLKSAAARDGVHLQLNSGFRTMDEQRHLYNTMPAGYAAYPGYSNHQHGQALDIDVVDQRAYDWMFTNAPRMGWVNTVAHEAWHWEYFGR